MMRFKMNKGFTLIELLAVIVVLAVIALIATPIIMNVINDSKKGSIKDSGYAIIKAAELMSAKMEFELPVKYTENDELNYKGTKPSKMGLEIDVNGKINLAAYIDGYCIVKGYSDTEVIIDDSKTTAEDCTSSMNANIVIDIKDGLIPVTYDENGNTVTADANTTWYDYDAKKWANAVSVTSESRSTYQTVSAGTPVKEEHILGYFVYIPRYRYQLWNAENGVSNPQEIKIEFERRSTPKSVGTKNLEWLTHPAFTFGSDELNGIWVGKFEMTGTSSVPSIKPNQVSLTNLNVSSFFNTVKSMQSEAYGLSSYDTHMMRNMEWGAAVYLSHSKYGKNAEIWINNIRTKSTASITGCGGVSASAEEVLSDSACAENYDYKNEGVNASTTGNITGIYDMSGGTWEKTMSVMLNTSGNIIHGSGGFNNTTMPDKKYYDAYETTTGDYDFTKGKLGDAIRESVTSLNSNKVGWYDDWSSMPIVARPWIHRGGDALGDYGNGGFSFYRYVGDEQKFIGSRAVVVAT